jgi:ABC-type lipoprotein release transport system permease subunit
VSVFTISSSLKTEANLTLDSLPEIIVQKMSGGRQTLILSDRVFEIAAMPNVEDAFDRVWGYYYFPNENVNFTIIGLDFDLEVYKEKYANIIELNENKIQSIDEPFMIVGAGVKNLLEKHFYKNYYNFTTVAGEKLETKIIASFVDESSLETNDVIIMPISQVRKLFGIEEDLANDIVVKIPNKNEIEIVKRKLQFMFPDTRIISTNDISASYQNMFDYKSGIFLALFISSIVAFFIIVYDKTSGLSAEEKREIGILKAIGWKNENIIQIKFIEGILVSLFSYFLGTALALIYVLELGAPVIRGLFTGASSLKPNFDLLPVVDFEVLVIIFILMVPVYILATIIPSWRASIIDADEVMR